MKHYLLFMLTITFIILSPGPGVMFTINNSLRLGFRKAFSGIFGLAVGTMVVATISATSLGIILSKSATAFTVIKYLGAAYLIYLGIKMWRANPTEMVLTVEKQNAKTSHLFLSALMVQLTNPKAIFFFLSIFPQFIEPQQNYTQQFAMLTGIFFVFMLLIHSCYALLAQYAKKILNSAKRARIFNRISASIFFIFGGLLASSQK